MARVADEPFTYLNEREIAATGLGTSPAGVAAYVDLQRAVYEAQPQDTAEAQAAAEAADAKADGAQSRADQAYDVASTAQTTANGAQARADSAYTLAAGKVTKITISPPPNYSGTASATYTQAEVQALMNQVQTLTAKVQAITAALQN